MIDPWTTDIARSLPRDGSWARRYSPMQDHRNHTPSAVATTPYTQVIDATGHSSSEHAIIASV